MRARSAARHAGLLSAVAELVAAGQALPRFDLVCPLLSLPRAFATDWRWLIGREDSPWYPTLRLFRQRERGDWDDVVRRLCAAVKQKLK